MNFRATTLLLAVLSVAPVAFAQTFPVEEQSKYRVVDKTGSTLTTFYAQFVMPDIGVGNTIFSTNPLPHKRDAEYVNVKTEFSSQEVLKTGFHARDFLPGRSGDLIKHVVAKNPGYTFLKKYTRIEYAAPDGKYEKMEAEDRLNPTTLTWSSRLTDFHPNNDYPNFPVMRVIDAKPGKHGITMTTYLVFDTGEKKVVSEMKDGKLVTERFPIYKEVAIAHGKATIIK